MTAAAVVRRRVRRHAVAIPVDITILRSGIPDSIPGRSVDLSERGLAVVLAGELHPADPVGVQLRLPSVGLPLHARALVRHEARLRCGLEFTGLSPEQQAMIRYWIQQKEERQAVQARVVTSPTPQATQLPPPVPCPRLPGPWLRRTPWLALAAFLILSGAGWWHWYDSWKQLESQIPRAPSASQRPRARVPSDVMEQLLTHKVDPVYPEAERAGNVQGIVTLDVRIGPDGSVVDVRPVSGPDGFFPAATEAVRWWRFQPYEVDGKPIEVETTVAVEFNPGS